jgi:hypothetical protein
MIFLSDGEETEKEYEERKNCNVCDKKARCFSVP